LAAEPPSVASNAITQTQCGQLSNPFYLTLFASFWLHSVAHQQAKKCRFGMREGVQG
jgi:hypothetical protein